MTRLRRALVDSVAASVAGRRRVQVPVGGELVWRWFADLSAARSYGAAGPNPISFTEIEAYRRLHPVPIEGRHVDLLRAMDDAWLRGQTADGDNPAVNPRRAMPVTPALFDAVFG